MKETVLNVPLKQSTREWLQDRSKRSGRAERREAQAIIEQVKIRSERNSR